MIFSAIRKALGAMSPTEPGHGAHSGSEGELTSVGKILNADDTAVFIQAIDDRRSGAQFTLQDLLR
ncbi:hypothetical protein LAB1_35410 [Roseibium sp. LAB1]